MGQKVSRQGSYLYSRYKENVKLADIYGFNKDLFFRKFSYIFSNIFRIFFKILIQWMTPKFDTPKFYTFLVFLFIEIAKISPKIAHFPKVVTLF